MTSLFRRGVVAAAFALAATSSQAMEVTFTDFDDLNSTLICTGFTCGGTPNSVSSTLDINAGAADGGVTLGSPYFPSAQTFNDSDGFRPGLDSALGGTFFVAVRDDSGSDRGEYIDIDLGGGLIDPFGIFEVDFDIFDASIEGVLLAQINATGQLDWDIRATNAIGTGSALRRDLIIDAVGLSVQATVVPIPAPIALLASAIAGLGLISLRKQRKA